MNPSQSMSRAAEIVNKNNAFAVVLPANPAVDAIAAGAAVYLGLTQLGKHVNIASSGTVSSTQGIPGSDKVQKKLASGGDQLVISFPYTEGSIDKVTYTIHDKKFNLLIIPREGHMKLDPQQVQYSYTGAKVDVIITIDTPNLKSLGQLYKQDKKQFNGSEIINIDRHLTNGNFGTANVVQKNVSSTSEIVLSFLSSLNVQLDKDIATAIYNGISAATNNFTSYSVNAQTMETAGYLLKAGAIKKTVVGGVPTRLSAMPSRKPFRPQQGNKPLQQFQQSPYSSDPYPQRPYPQMPSSQFPPVPSSSYTPGQTQPQQYSEPQAFQPAQGGDQDFDQDPRSQPQHQTQLQEPQQQEIPEQSASTQQLQQESQMADQKNVENKEVRSDEETSEHNKSAPKEWLKPKIFKGSNLV